MSRFYCDTNSIISADSKDLLNYCTVSIVYIGGFQGLIAVKDGVT